jgi:hypothetical protein
LNRIVLLMAALLALAVSAPSSTASPLAGLRVLTVTDREADGTKHVNSFFVSDTDRVYITRTEVDVIHSDGSVAGVDFYGKFGNMTLSKVKK